MLSKQSGKITTTTTTTNVAIDTCLLQMWACALGHMESALLLYRWRPHCLKMSDSLGRLPLDVAKSRGHTSLADSLVQLGQEEPHLWSPLDASPSPKSDPIQIPQSGRNVLPAFMVSSPATNTPSSSLSDDSAPIFEAQSPSSGCLSNLSGSPVSQGLVTPNMGASPQMSPRLQDLPGTSSGSLGNMLNVQQGFLRRDSGVSVKSTSPHHHHGQSHTHHLSSSPQFPAGGIPMPIPPPISQATLKAFLSGSQILGNLDPAELMGLHPMGDREHADQKEMWESFVKELQVAAQQQEDREMGSGRRNNVVILLCRRMTTCHFSCLDLQLETRYGLDLKFIGQTCFSFKTILINCRRNKKHTFTAV